MKLRNNSKNAYIHVQGRTKIYLGLGQVAEVPEEIAKTWLKYDGVEEYISPEEIEALKKATKKTKTK